MLDVKELGKGMDLVRRECSLHDHAILKSFHQTSDTQLDKLQKDAKTAEVSFLSFRKHFLAIIKQYQIISISHCIHLQEAFNNVVNYFGESPKTTPPSVFFPVFVRFIRAYKVIHSVIHSAVLGTAH